MPTRTRLSLTAIAVLLAAGAMTGCGLSQDVQRSWEFSRWAASEVQRGEAEELCASFSQEMLGAVPCDSLERLLLEVRAAMGEPSGECLWAYTYRIASLGFRPSSRRRSAAAPLLGAT